jgi:Pyruvate/2-oxoacid:ferredoxin oxidoreductase gamma subunit
MLPPRPALRIVATSYTGKEETMSVVSQNIEELEGSVERAQVVLDQVRRALDAAESAEQHAADAAGMLRRAAGVIAVGAAVAVAVILLGRVRA